MAACWGYNKHVRCRHVVHGLANVIDRLTVRRMAVCRMGKEHAQRHVTVLGNLGMFGNDTVVVDKVTEGELAGVACVFNHLLHRRRPRPAWLGRGFLVEVSRGDARGSVVLPVGHAKLEEKVLGNELLKLLTGGKMVPVTHAHTGKCVVSISFRCNDKKKNIVEEFK